MKSFGIWCSKKENKKDSDIFLDAHFNFWKIPQKNRDILTKYTYILDIGLMVNSIKDIDCIKVYIPIEDIKEKDIIDLGGKLHKNHQLINAIFNEDYRNFGEPYPKQTQVRSHDKKTEFIIYSLDTDKDFQVLNEYGGSIIEIAPENTTYGFNKCYFRFRVSTNKLNQLFRRNQSKGSFFENAFTVTEVLDFRLNEKRNYNHTMAERIINEGEFIIKKVHFLLLLVAKDDVVSYGENFSCRELEKDLWDSYIEPGVLKKNIIAHHWREKSVGTDEKEGIGSFNKLIKIKFRATNCRTILWYLLLFLILNIISFYITNFFDKDIKPVILQVFNSQQSVLLKSEVVK